MKTVFGCLLPLKALIVPYLYHTGHKSIDRPPVESHRLGGVLVFGLRLVTQFWPIQTVAFEE